MIIKKIASKILSNYYNIIKLCKSLKYFINIIRLPIRHYEPSVMMSIDDDIGAIKGADLLPLCTKIINNSIRIKLKELKNTDDNLIYNIFPGEHYKLLAGVVKTLEPKTIIEIGTYKGMSSRAMLDAGSEGIKVHTFDIVEWHKFDSHLNVEDFETGRLVQHICDLSNDLVFEKYIDIFNDAELIFLDGPKDGKFEYELLKNILQSQILGKQKERILIIDDIKFLNMVKLWRYIESPKIDISSLAHWSGTGVVDLSKTLKINNKAFLNNISQYY